MALSTYVPVLVAALLGVGIGYLASHKMGSKKAENLDGKIDQKLAAAKEKIQTFKAETEREVQELREKAEKEADVRRNQIIELENRVSERETKLETKIESVEQKEQELASTRAGLEKDREKLTVLLVDEQKHLTEISGLTTTQASKRIMEQMEEQTKEEIIRRVRKLEQEGESQLEEKARNILSTVIQRYAASHIAENSTSYVDVPDASMIGRIIGKEGRNIQHIERLTGCEIVIDETPNSIMISGFSPIRRQVAKRAIEALIKDGRVHPGRIEEVV